MTCEWQKDQKSMKILICWGENLVSTMITLFPSPLVKTWFYSVLLTVTMWNQCGNHSSKWMLLLGPVVFCLMFGSFWGISFEIENLNVSIIYKYWIFQIFKTLYLNCCNHLNFLSDKNIHPGRLTWNLKTHLFGKENHLPNHHFQVLC